MQKFKELKYDLKVFVKPAWGSNKRLIVLPAKGNDQGKKWKWNGSLENPSIVGAILVNYKNSKLHFWIKDGKTINYGDGVDVELISIAEEK